ncbi:HAD hydrolase-like protein [Mucilaginibacter sp. RS28]|uniref:HAD hydrolase-like protein n=1 Tax=Mucilaginibacter straminoryzae TaxID=2932774 RepID=A0A9X2B8G6_9SPHI|nr:HAD hydrolase-like protein [Mucilaginibacter straminoryzae]MCJ8209594.1 HAD hydrolase-like protein [Mucilaginibacter straminoryzae]
MKPIKLVVFDLAGTTVKDKAHDVSRALINAMETYGYTVSFDDVDPIMGYQKTVAIKMLLDKHEPNSDKVTVELINQIHETFVEMMLAHYRTSPGISSLPQVEETFEALHQLGIKVGLDTGFTRNIADAIIGRLQWQEKGLIDYVIGSDEVEQGRPYPFMIQKLMYYAQVEDPQQVVKVGDTAVDMEEGLNAGCKLVVGVTTGIYSREELLKASPHHVIDNVADILELIKAE